MQLNLLFITFTLLNITPNQLTSATNNLIPLDIAINNTCKNFNINILFEYTLNKKITPIPEHSNLEESIIWIKKQTDTNFEKLTNSYIFYNNSHSESPIISTSQAIEYTQELQKCLINIKNILCSS